MKIIIKNLNTVALVLVLIAFVFVYKNYSKINSQLVELRAEFDKKYGELNLQVSSETERLDNKISRLIKEGYVEQDEFANFAAKAASATVLITSSRDIVNLSETGQATIGKEEDPAKGAGTGFLVSSDGLIVTAKHVVDSIGPDNLMVRTLNSQNQPGKVLTIDDKSDIAIIKIDGRNYDPAAFGYYDNFQTGDEVGFVGFAISAGVIKPLVHKGVISSKLTEASGVKTFTVNAFVNSGNSGSPVFLAKSGRVIGMLSARQRDTAAASRFLKLPPNYQSAFIAGGIDPVKFNVDLYNKTLEIVGDVSQIGIGLAYSTDNIRSLIEKAK